MAELQTTMSSRELSLWGRYRRKYGPLNPVRMYDAGPALIASIISQAHGGKARPKDFMPYGRSAEESDDTFVDTQTFIAALMNTGRARVVNT